QAVSFCSEFGSEGSHSPRKKSSAVMPWRCLFESPCCLGGRLEPGLCDPLFAEADQRLYTRPSPLSQVPNGHLIGSPKTGIRITNMEEDTGMVADCPPAGNQAM